MNLPERPKQLHIFCLNCLYFAGNNRAVSLRLSQIEKLFLKV